MKLIEMKMNIEEYVKREKCANVQIYKKNSKKCGKDNDFFLQELHIQKKMWGGHNKNVLCWAFYCVSDGKEVEKVSHQIMRCILCYVKLVNVLNLRTKERKGFITYYKTCGITTLKKHVGAYHSIITKKIE